MEQDKERKVKKGLEKYAKYTGLGFQILGAILLGFFIGHLLDKYVFHTSHPIWTVVFSFLMLIVALYQLIKQLSKP